MEQKQTKQMWEKHIRLLLLKDNITKANCIGTNIYCKTLTQTNTITHTQLHQRNIFVNMQEQKNHP